MRRRSKKGRAVVKSGGIGNGEQSGWVLVVVRGANACMCVWNAQWGAGVRACLCVCACMECRVRSVCIRVNTDRQAYLRLTLTLRCKVMGVHNHCK